jgi:hypothetical protein
MKYDTQGYYSKSKDFYPQDISTCRNPTQMNANSKQKSKEKLQPASTSIPSRYTPREPSCSSSLCLYTFDLPTSRETTLGTFADDTAIYATHENIVIASLILQEHLHIIEKWLKKWRIKFNESKSPHINLPSGKVSSLQSASTKLSHHKQK